MKIGIIHSIYKPYSRGGAEVVVQSIVSGLKKRDHDIFVLSVGKENKIDNIDGEKIYRVDSPNVFNFLDINSQPVWKRFIWHIFDMFNIFSAIRVYKIFKSEKPDFVFCQGMKGIGYLTLPVLRILNIRVIQRIYDMQLLHPSGLIDDKKKPSFFARIYSWFCRKLFGNPSIVIFPSQYIKGIYEKYGFFKKSKRVVIGNPIKNIPPLPEGGIGGVGDVENPPVLQNDKFNILFLGQIEEYKGILNLIKIINELQITNCKLHIVGDGSALVKAKELAKESDNIIFHGKMSHDEMEERIWPNINLLVNPSQTPESFGMVVLESFVHGIPVLVSNIGALPELVTDNQNGWVIGDDEWQDKIDWCIENKEKLGDMRESCIQKAREYNIEEYLNKLVEFGNIG